MSSDSLACRFYSSPSAPILKRRRFVRTTIRARWWLTRGTHDTDTTVGWWSSEGHGESTRSDDDIRRERDFAMRYLNTDGREIHWMLIRTLQASVADTVLISSAGCAGIRHRGAHESARDVGRELALAVSGRGAEAGAGAALAGDGELYDS